MIIKIIKYIIGLELKLWKIFIIDPIKELINYKY